MKITKHKLTTSLVIAALLIILSSGCANNNKTVGERLDDTVLSSKVNFALAKASHVPSSNIDVTIDRGIVQLSGFVENQADARAAEHTVRKVEGVQDVINTLIVKEKPAYRAERAAIAAQHHQ